jgi:SAM-dependent methyltransferase
VRAALGALVFAAAAIAGWAFRDDPYRADELWGQAVLRHRDSAYGSITWMAARDANSMQLRFFRGSEGDVCAFPAWSEYAALAEKDPRLAHLVPRGAPAPAAAPPGPEWPHHDWTPDPGTLTGTAYNALFPVGLLLNARLMEDAQRAAQAAGAPPEDAYRYARPRVLVVGLGPGSGIAMLAHHFPEASITVVDIDPVVLEMVEDHYPLMRWLTEQKTSDGRPRLRLVAQDARQYIRYQALRDAREHPWDLVVLDAFVAGGSIPSHLMTREFFAACSDLLGPDGVLLSNVNGAYGRARTPGAGKNARNKHLVLGGAIRSMRAAGFPDVYNVPLNRANETAATFRRDLIRNNITLASRAPLGPDRNAEGWRRVSAFVPYPELPVGRYVSRVVALMGGEHAIASPVLFEPLERAAPGLRARLVAAPGVWPHVAMHESADRAVIDEVVRLVRAEGGPLPAGWERAREATTVRLSETDVVARVREKYAASIELGKDPALCSATALVGPAEDARRGPFSAIIPDAPLFTDSKPNADIYNN